MISRIRRTAADEPFLVLRSVSAEAGDGQTTDRHAHSWGQLIYSASGVMTVWTDEGSWVAPPHWAIWVPAGVSHEIRFVGRCALRTLYLRPDLASELPGRCGVIGVTPLLRELVLRATAIGMLDSRDESQAAIARLILSELVRREVEPYQLLAPSSPAARRAAALLSESPGGATVNAVAREVGLSTRALERRFLAETGLPIARWSRQARLLQALRRLAGGASVKAAAHEAGYATDSAFVAAFRGSFGVTPRRYFG
jgi:AraC-like DNA-binding protein